jgi:hypothetical protein
MKLLSPLRPLTFAAIHRSQRNALLQSPVARPVRVYLPPQLHAARIESEALWSHADAALTVVLPENAGEVHVDWV